MRKTLIAIALVPFLLLAGCTGTESNPERREAVMNIVLTLATARFFNERPEYAEVAFDVTSAMISALETGELVTLSLLEARALELIPWERLLPAEERAVRDLVTLVRLEIEGQLPDTGIISAEAREKVIRVLSAVQLAAMPVTPPL